MLTKNDIYDLIDQVEMCNKQSELCVFTCGSGLSDRQVIDYFKNDHSVIVVDRKFDKWCAGERVLD